MNVTVSTLLARKGREVYCVPPTATVAQAVAAMNEHRVGSVLIMQEGALLGIFTERDVLRRVVGPGKDPSQLHVTDVMTANVLTIAPTTSIDEAIDLFTDKRLRHLPVMDDGRLVGTISSGDVTRWFSDHHRAEAEHLKNYIAGGFQA